MALYPEKAWEAFVRPMIIPTGNRSIEQPPYGRFVLVYRGQCDEMEHPNEVLPNIINDSWIQEFIQEHRIPDMRISCYRDPATLFVKVAIELWMSRESEFVLRLQHSNSLPHR